MFEKKNEKGELVSDVWGKRGATYGGKGCECENQSLREEVEQGAHARHGLHIVRRKELRDARLARVGLRAAERLGAHRLVGDLGGSEVTDAVGDLWRSKRRSRR